MIIIACVDNAMGMAFNKRRQSRDRALRRAVVALVGDGRLLMNEYSARQFSDVDCPNLYVSDAFLDESRGGDFCFVEDARFICREAEIKKIILFKWNRDYPSDLLFPVSLSDEKWKMTATVDFSGSAHEKITREDYERQTPTAEPSQE